MRPSIRGRRTSHTETTCGSRSMCLRKSRPACRMTVWIKLSRSAAKLGCSERTRRWGSWPLPGLCVARTGRSGGGDPQRRRCVCCRQADHFELRRLWHHTEEIAGRLLCRGPGHLSRKRVREAVQALAADDETVTPVRVARKIAAQELPSMNPDSLRYYTRKFRPTGAGQEGDRSQAATLHCRSVSF